jgi:hypothetical protein
MIHGNGRMSGSLSNRYVGSAEVRVELVIRTEGYENLIDGTVDLKICQAES